MDGAGAASGELSTTAPADSIDVYKFTIPSDGFLQIGLVPTKDLNVEILLQDTDGVVNLVYKNGGGNGGMESIVYPNLRAGTYFAIVKIPDAIDPVHGTYDIALNYVVVEEIDQEPNDLPGQAVVMPVKGDIRGHLGFTGSRFTDLRDYFKIVLPKDGKLELTGLPDGTLSFSMGLYDISSFKNFSWVDTSGKGAKVKLVYPNLLAGTYIVLLNRGEGDGSYTLTSLFTEDANQDTEPNDLTAQAYPVVLTDAAVSATVQGRLGYYGNQVQDNNDYFKVTIPAYGNLAFGFTADAGEGLSVGYNVFDESLRYIGSGDNNLTLEGLVQGTYYVRMYRNAGWGSYSLKYTYTKKEQPLPVNVTSTEMYASNSVNNINLSAESPSAWVPCNFAG